MKILFFFLSLMVFRPLQAQADTVFNDTESFTIAKAIRLGRDSSSGTSLKGTASPSGLGAGKGGVAPQSLSGGTGGCAANKFKNKSGTCSACPSPGGYCNGSSNWACKKNYYKDNANEACRSCDASFANCTGGEYYTCVGSLKSNDWKADGSYKWRDESKSNMSATDKKGKCQSCPNSYTECNGTSTVYCKGTKTSTGYKAANAFDTGNSNMKDKCIQCPGYPNSECNGSGTYYCKGYAAGTWTSSNYWKDTSKAWDKYCQSCETNGVCNGNTTYWCKGYNGTDGNWSSSNYWKDNSKSYPNKCQKCENSNYLCNGKTKRCNGTNNDGTASSSYSTAKAYSPSSGKCESCPSMNECNGINKQCLGKQEYKDKGAWKNAPTDKASTEVAWKNGSTCTACPKYGRCNGVDLKCHGYNGTTTNWVKGKTNAYLSSSTACSLCPNNYTECNGIDKRCYGIQNNGNPVGESGRDNKYAYNASGTCTACPGNAKCNGQKFYCNDGYFKFNGDSSTSCKEINTKDVVKCKSGFSVLVAYDSNTIYCVQPY